MTTPTLRECEEVLRKFLSEVAAAGFPDHCPIGISPEERWPDLRVSHLRALLARMEQEPLRL